jgi:hypothetical protein
MIATLIPGARFVPLESRNHILVATEPAWQQFVDALDDFLPASSSELAAHLFLRRTPMMPQPAARNNWQLCDSLRYCTTPRGRLPSRSRRAYYADLLTFLLYHTSKERSSTRNSCRIYRRQRTDDVASAHARTHPALTAHIFLPGKRLACLTQAAS